MRSSHLEHRAAITGARAAPRTWSLVVWLHRAGAARFRFRLLQGFALSLALNEVTLYWLATTAGAPPTLQMRMLASTAFWTLWLAVGAGWVLLGGWFEEPTRALVSQLTQRRGYGSAVGRTLETLASWRWLSMLLAFPTLACGIVAAVRVPSLAQLGALASSVALGLLFTQLMAALVIAAGLSLRSFEPGQARRIWLFVCVVPELLRPLLPGLPTLRLLANLAETSLLRWGSGG